MEHLRRNKVCDLLKSTEYGKEVLVKGWVRTRRGNKNVNFIALNDGSIIHSIQVVIDMANFGEEALKPVTTGSCIAVKGILVESKGQGQSVEIQGREIEVYGTADPETYPLQKKGHTLEFLREIAHLRPRTNTSELCSGYVTPWLMPSTNITMITGSSTCIRRLSRVLMLKEQEQCFAFLSSIRKIRH